MYIIKNHLYDEDRRRLTAELSRMVMSHIDGLDKDGISVYARNIGLLPAGLGNLLENDAWTFYMIYIVARSLGMRVDIRLVERMDA
jgi:hypothetical protein